MKLFGNRRRTAKPETRRTDPEAADRPAFASAAEDDEIPEPRKRRRRLSGLQRGLTLLVLSVALLVLECFGIFEFGNLLELVDANNDITTFLLRYLFRELQDFIDLVALGIHFKRYGKIRHRISPQRYFRADTRKE